MPVLKARIGGAWQEVGLVQADEVWIGPTAPADSSVELWYDSDEADAPLNGSNIAFTPTGFVAATNVQSAIAEVSDESPKGIVAWKPGSHSAAAISSTPLTIYSLAATLTAGRMYEVKFTSRAMNGNATYPYVYFANTMTPACPSQNVASYVYAPAAYGSISHSFLVYPSVTQSYTITIQASVGGGAGNIWTEGSYCGIWIMDIGKAVASS